MSHDSPQQRLQPSHHFAIDSPHDSCRKGDDPSKVAHGVLSDERCESTITHVLRKGAFLAKSTSSSSHATAQTRPITRTREIAPQPHAVQFLRRAIELSPGHGKAHMCAPHAASPGVNMLPHSDLGYRLLPKNPFAINNYILYLQLHGRPISQIIPLAYAGIEADPQDPGNYDRLMEMLAKTGDFQNALQVALALQKYYEPVMNPRTRYCLEQNPKMRELLRSGQFDPVDALRRKIGWLQGKL